MTQRAGLVHIARHDLDPLRSYFQQIIIAELGADLMEMTAEIAFRMHEDHLVDVLRKVILVLDGDEIAVLLARSEPVIARSAIHQLGELLAHLAPPGDVIIEVIAATEDRLHIIILHGLHDLLRIRVVQHIIQLIFLPGKAVDHLPVDQRQIIVPLFQL